MTKHQSETEPVAKVADEEGSLTQNQGSATAWRDLGGRFYWQRSLLPGHVSFGWPRALNRACLRPRSAQHQGRFFVASAPRARRPGHNDNCLCPHGRLVVPAGWWCYASSVATGGPFGTQLVGEPPGKFTSESCAVQHGVELRFSEGAASLPEQAEVVVGPLAS